MHFSWFKRTMFYRIFFLLFILLLSIVTLSTTSSAQQIESPVIIDNYWIDGGVGIQLGKGGAYSSGTLSANYQHNYLLYKLRFSTYSNDFLGTGNTELKEFGFMMGEIFPQNFSHTYYAAGLGIFAGTIGTLEKTNYNGGTLLKTRRKKIATIGIPFEVGYSYLPVKFSGITVALHGNLNFHRPLVGVNLKVPVGKMR